MNYHPTVENTKMYPAVPAYSDPVERAIALARSAVHILLLPIRGQEEIEHTFVVDNVFPMHSLCGTVYLATHLAIKRFGFDVDYFDDGGMVQRAILYYNGPKTSSVNMNPLTLQFMEREGPAYFYKVLTEYNILDVVGWYRD